MTHYDRAELDSLKKSIDLAIYAQHIGVDLHAIGSKYRGNCPIPGHSDKTPSFYVNPSDYFYHCFGCGCSGDIYELNKLVYGDSFSQSVERVKSYLGGNLSVEGLRSAPVAPLRQLGGKDRKILEHVVSHLHELFKSNSEAQEYLHSRRISDQVFDQFEIGFGNGYLNRRFPRSSKPLQKMGLVTEKGTD